MRIKLVYFSWIRESLDMTDEMAELPATVKTVGDLLAWQKSRGDEFVAVFEHDKVVRVAINQEHVDDRLGDDPRDRGAADVVQRDHPIAQHALDPARLLKKCAPPSR